MILPRTGIGMDVHAFVDDGRTGLALAGVHFPDEPALEGHSDGDVVAHAAADALFSAAGLGDLGSQFGTTDPQWADAAGMALLSEAAVRVRAAGFDIGNIAIQLIGARPRLGPSRDEAELRLSQSAGAHVSIAATTTENLGFTGRGEGLAAIATALIIARDELSLPV